MNNNKTSARVEGPSTASLAAAPVSGVTALPPAQRSADPKALDALRPPTSASNGLDRLGNGHLLCHTCKKASIESDPQLMAEFEMRHTHHDKEDLRIPRFFAKPEAVKPSPTSFASRALAEKQVSAFNAFSAAAHRFDRDLATVRSLDRTGQLDAGLAHLESAWFELGRDYLELHAHLSRFVATQYYAPEQAPAASEESAPKREAAS